MVKSTSINKNLSVLIGVITAILLGMVLLISQGYDPIESYGRIIHYSLMTSKGRANTLTRIVFLIIAGCSASIGLGSGASNLGQFGQILLGAFTANIVGLYLPLPAVILLPLMVVVGCAAGALYSGLAALGKKYFQMNEFITHPEVMQAAGKAAGDFVASQVGATDKILSDILPALQH